MAAVAVEHGIGGIERPCLIENDLIRCILKMARGDLDFVTRAT
jgi:hypothetical protein